ncbi:Uncharacterised protein [BD1-7 clade bacterium]|uniref:Cobalt-zinc-cadmium resistance protein CzcC n=1 Tax=BD1-7 clade bacterium TaxID=2029982 RepID=A0A5S9R214_9GAMM|nr:Uncharacterised protein [BD1-7 clade bacterium]
MFRRPRRYSIGYPYTLTVCVSLLSVVFGSLFLTPKTFAAEHRKTSSIQYAALRLSADRLAGQVLAENAGLRARRFQAQAAEREIDVVNRFDDPTFSYAIAPQSINSDIGTRQIVQFSQPVPWPGKLDIEADMSRARAKAAGYQVTDFQLSLIRQSRSLWSMWWYLHEALAVNEDNKQLLEELQSVVSTQYAAGLGLQQDLLQVQTQQVHVHHQSVVIQQQIKRLRAKINGLQNVRPNAPLPRPERFPNIPTLPIRDTLIDWLTVSHPGLKTLQAQSDVAAASMRLADADDFPDLRLNATWNDLLEPYEKHLQLGVSVNLPFSFGRREANKSVQKSRFYSANATLDDSRSQLMAGLQSNLELVDETAGIIHIYQTELIPKTRQTLEAAKADYQAGRGEFANVILAEQQLLNAQLDLAVSQRDNLDALAEISMLTGGHYWPLLTDETATSGDTAHGDR